MFGRIESNAHMMSQVLLSPSLGLACLCLISDSNSSQRGKVVLSVPNLHHSAQPAEKDLFPTPYFKLGKALMGLAWVTYLNTNQSLWPGVPWPPQVPLLACLNTLEEASMIVYPNTASHKLGEEFPQFKTRKWGNALLGKHQCCCDSLYISSQFKEKKVEFIIRIPACPMECKGRHIAEPQERT